MHSRSNGRRRKKHCGPFASELPQRCATGAASFACSPTPWYLQRCGRRITRRRAEVSRRPLNSTPARGCYPLVPPAHPRNCLCSNGLQKTRRQKHYAESFRDVQGPPPPRKRLWKCLFFLHLQSPLLKHPPRYQEDPLDPVEPVNPLRLGVDGGGSLRRTAVFVGTGKALRRRLDGEPASHHGGYQSPPANRRDPSTSRLGSVQD
jgi:hypothetical protein